MCAVSMMNSVLHGSSTASLVIRLKCTVGCLALVGLTRVANNSANVPSQART